MFVWVWCLLAEGPEEVTFHSSAQRGKKSLLPWQWQVKKKMWRHTETASRVGTGAGGGGGLIDWTHRQTHTHTYTDRMLVTFTFTHSQTLSKHEGWYRGQTPHTHTHTETQETMLCHPCLYGCIRWERRHTTAKQRCHFPSPGDSQVVLVRFCWLQLNHNSWSENRLLCSHLNKLIRRKHEVGASSLPF